MPRLGQWIERHDALPSTNDRALSLARAGAKEGWIIQADTQTAGRGQRGAGWHSPENEGLYVSFLLRPRIPPERLAFMTLAAGVAVGDALHALRPGAVGLKWPNDVLLAQGPDQGAKVAGILVESAADAKSVLHVVVGVGINLTGHPEVQEPRARALDRVGPPLDPPLVLATMASALETRVQTLEEDGPAPLITAWTDQALGLGEPVEVLESGRPIQNGRLIGLTAEGHVRVQTPAGELVSAHAKLRLSLERGWLSFAP